jgi:hypothetical protein
VESGKSNVSTTVLDTLNLPSPKFVPWAKLTNELQITEKLKLEESRKQEI